VATDIDEGLILIKGAVPGSKNGWILINDAVKKPANTEAPYPGAVRAAPAETAPAEEAPAAAAAEENKE